MRYIIFTIFMALTISCSRQQVYYDIRPANISYEILEKQFVQITDTNQIMQLNAILSTGCDDPDIKYFCHRLYKENPCFVVRLDDYFTREFAIWDDKSYIELSYEGGDGPYYSRSYSTPSKDSLITYVINIEYLIDEYMDTILDEYTIDTIRYAIPLNGKRFPLYRKINP